MFALRRYHAMPLVVLLSYSAWSLAASDALNMPRKLAANVVIGAQPAYPMPMALNEYAVLMNKNIDYVVHLGKPRKMLPRHETVNNIGFDDAMRALLPTDWVLKGTPGIRYHEMLVSWREGDDWLAILEKLGEQQQIIFRINWARQTVFIHPSDEEGAYSAKPAIGHAALAPVSVHDYGVSAVQTYTLQAGETLRTALERWVQQAGYQQLAWQLSADNGESADIPITVTHTFNTDFLAALSAIKLAYGEANEPLYLFIKAHPANGVLFVSQGSAVDAMSPVIAQDAPLFVDTTVLADSALYRQRHPYTFTLVAVTK